MRYELLHYKGDITKDVVEGSLLGADEFGRPYAILDAEYDPERDLTSVHLGYAEPEVLKQAQGWVQDHFAAQSAITGLFRPEAVA